MCQYARCGQVSSEKHERPPAAGAEGRGGDTSGVAIAAGVRGGPYPLLEPPEVMTRSAKAAKALRSKTCAKLYPEDTILKRLPQALEDLEALGASIQEAHAVVRPRHLARHGDVPTADLPHI